MYRCFHIFAIAIISFMMLTACSNDDDKSHKSPNIDYSEGLLPGLFSVDSNRVVSFSCGNLQYNILSNTFRFAQLQYESVGFSNRYVGDSSATWIDLFGWGTSGWSGSGAMAYMPYSTSINSEDYMLVDSVLRFDSTFYYDWGIFNPIFGGGFHRGLWRTLSRDEWHYLLFQRATTALSGCTNARFFKSRVSGVRCLVLLPDHYEHPFNLNPPVEVNNATAGYVNSYSAQQWFLMESAGAVALPVTGWRRGTSVYDVESDAYYWTLSLHSGQVAYAVHCSDSSLSTHLLSPTNIAYSVRLVRDMANGH